MNFTAAPEFSHDDILQLLLVEYRLSGELTVLDSYRDQNLLLKTSDKQSFVVKISNIAESEVALDLQNAAMCQLFDQDIAASRAIANRQGQLISKIGTDERQPFCLRVLTFLAGSLYAELETNAHNEPLWASLGRFVATTSIALEGFQHAGAYRFLVWDLAQGYAVCQRNKQLLPLHKQTQINYFLLLYQTQTMPRLSELPQSIIHNDMNDYNVLVDQQRNIVGLIDFGDVVHSHTVNELAIACAYALMGLSKPLDALKIIVASYCQLRPLSSVELEVLYSLISLRLCTTVCNSALAIQNEPDNQYLLVSVAPAWHLLQQLQGASTDAVSSMLRDACQSPAARATATSGDSMKQYKTKP